MLTFNFQNLFYILGCEQQFGIKISGVLYDIIRNPGTKPKVNETKKQFAERLQKDICKNPDYYFKRIELFYSKAERDEFTDELAMKLGEIDAVLAGDLPVYRNECICEKPFPCEFLDTCSSGTFAGLVQKDTLFSELSEK